MDGLNGSTAALCLGSLFTNLKRTCLVLEDDAERAGYIYHDLVQLLGPEQVRFYPPSFKRTLSNGEDPGSAILRTDVLNTLQQGVPGVIVAYPDSLLENVTPDQELKTKLLDLHQGERIDTGFVIELLHDYGFERVDYVYEPGQFSVRGSLIDVFSWGNEWPYRLDFFGDELESLRTFNIETQLSKDQVTAIRIIPKT
ncbi:MAG: transcription-repair coupling factor, partial [Bacteroidales bacterium]|nr:transcription-repair coupling factor [Bacteroidales bacterium]